MFKLAKKDKRTELEKKIDAELIRICEESENSAEDLTKIIELMDNWNAYYHRKKIHISPDTLAIVAANLLGIALILGYEKSGAITSKALGFVMRGRA